MRFFVHNVLIILILIDSVCIFFTRDIFISSVITRIICLTIFDWIIFWDQSDSDPDNVSSISSSSLKIEAWIISVLSLLACAARVSSNAKLILCPASRGTDRIPASALILMTWRGDNHHPLPSCPLLMKMWTRSPIRKSFSFNGWDSRISVNLRRPIRLILASKSCLPTGTGGIFESTGRVILSQLQRHWECQNHKDHGYTNSSYILYRRWSGGVFMT